MRLVGNLFFENAAMNTVQSFLLGSYLTGAVFTFVIVLMFTALGGNSSELWKPFFYAATWPVSLLLFLAGW